MTTKHRTLLLGVCGVWASAHCLAAQCPDGTPPPCAVRAARSTPAPTSVAVLYFENLSRDTSDAYLADGLTEEITTRLGQLGRLVVASSATMRRFRSPQGLDPRAVGHALGVAHLVSGSVRRSGHRLRLRVELLRARDGVQVWSETYDRSDADLLAIEEEVAGAVATAIAGRLLPQERATLAARPTRSPEAYDRLLRGNYYLGQRTPPAMARAIAEYQAAVRLDAGFVAALARIAYSYGVLYNWGFREPIPPESALVRGLAAAEAALGRDSATSDAWLARGILLTQRNPCDFADVGQSYRRALALDPRNAEAYHRLGTYLTYVGKDSAALASYLRAFELEPDRPVTFLDLAQMLVVQRRYADALRWLDSGLVVERGNWYLLAERSRARRLSGDSRSSRADAEAVLEMGANSPTALWAVANLALLDVAAGDSASARSRLDTYLSRLTPPPTPHEAAELGAVMVALGQRERALAFISSAQPQGLHLGFHLRVADFDPVRGDPQFRRFIDRCHGLEGP